jgi:hypothetical protein
MTAPKLSTRPTKASHESDDRPVNPIPKPEFTTKEAVPKEPTLAKPEVKKPIADSITSQWTAYTQARPQVAEPKVEMINPEPSSPVKPESGVVRYSMRRDDGGGRDRKFLRVFLFIIIVVALGVGLTLLLQNYLASQQNAPTVADNGADPAPILQLPEGISITTGVLSDTLATNVGLNSNFNTTSAELGSAENDVSAAELATVDYAGYTSFSRTTFAFTGLDDGLPSISTAYDTDTNIITLIMKGIKVANNSMLADFDIEAGNLKKISLSQDALAVTATLEMTRAGKYRVFINEQADGLSIDTRTEAQLTSFISSSSSSSSSASSSASSVSSSSASTTTGDVRFDNTKSQSKQKVINPAVSSNTLNMVGYYFQDFGPQFEFNWSFEGTGEGSIPNAQTRTIEVEGVLYTEVTIYNLASDYFHAAGTPIANLGSVNLQYSNLVQVQLRNHNAETGTSVYWVKMRYPGDIRLHAKNTQNGRQLLTLEVYDWL